MHKGYYEKRMRPHAKLGDHDSYETIIMHFNN